MFPKVGVALPPSQKIEGVSAPADTPPPVPGHMARASARAEQIGEERKLARVLQRPSRGGGDGDKNTRNPEDVHLCSSSSGVGCGVSVNGTPSTQNRPHV